MDTPRPQSLIRRMPRITCLVLGAAIAVALIPKAQTCLIYDRAAILSGQFWRLFTGHWVHFSTAHLVGDGLAIGIVGWIIESKRLPHFGWLCLTAPWFISAALLCFEPQLHYYGGLSAMAVCLIVYACLSGLQERGAWRWMCLAALVVLAAKLIMELATGRMLLASAVDPSITVCTPAHLAGMLFAAMYYSLNRSTSIARQPASTM